MGLDIVAHEPFISLEMAIKENMDIHSTIEVENILATKGQVRVMDRAKGRERWKEIEQLEMLVAAYEMGIIKENHDYRLVKVHYNH